MQECNVALSSVGVGSRVGGEAVSPHKRGIDIVQDICPYFSALVHPLGIIQVSESKGIDLRIDRVGVSANASRVVGDILTSRKVPSVCGCLTKPVS